MFPAKTAKLLELKTLCRLLFVLVGYVIAVFAITALQYDIVSHIKYSVFSFPFSAASYPTN
jgi:hypothetical protein